MGPDGRVDVGAASGLIIGTLVASWICPCGPCDLDLSTSEPGGAWMNCPLGPEGSVFPTPSPSFSGKAGGRTQGP